MKTMGSSQSRARSNLSDSSSSNVNLDLDDNSEEYLSLESDMDDSTITTDAADTRHVFTYPSIEEINLLDNILDDYEKVSLVYLGYGDPQKAYDILQHPLSTVIRDWCYQQSQINRKWNWKLLELLCIIKNYKVLRILGYGKADMISIFLPNNGCVALQVNIVRKALYCIFENLTEDQLDRLLLALQRDLSRNCMQCYVDRDNLELTFLCLEKVGYCSLTDLRKVCHLFKSIDMLSEYEHLKNLQQKTSSASAAQSNVTNLEGSFNVLFSNDDTNEPHSSQNVRHIDYLLKQNVMKPTGTRDRLPNHIPDTEECYHMDFTKPGLVLIIDNKDFYTEWRKEFAHLQPSLPNKMENRQGTDVDRDRLITTFQDLRYEVIVRSNLTHDMIVEVIKETIKIAEGFSSFFVAILSHGDLGVVYGCNTIPVRISKIEEIVCSSSLRGKPKVLLIQACQGPKLQDLEEDLTTDGGIPSTSKATSARMSDMLSFYATIPKYIALRHPQEGTWFIQSLCDRIANNKEDHFEDICLKVKQDVSNKRWGTVVMVAITHSTLTKKLHLTSLTTNYVIGIGSTS